jgi:predicted MFS family arabinose efflux permease
MPEAMLAGRIPAIARNGSFRALWAAQTLSTFGDALTTLTLVLLVTQRTRSVAAVGALTVAVAVPGIAVGLFAGAAVDRWDRRRTMIVSDAVRAVLLVALALAVAAGPGLLPVYGIAVAQAVAGTFFTPARAALMQVVVAARDQLRANSLLQTGTVVAELAGTALAGVLVAAAHAYWIAFVLDGATFAASALLVRTVRVPAGPPLDRPQQDRPQPAWAAVLDGLRAVRSSPVLRALLLVFTALSFALSPMAVLLAPYVMDTLHLSTGWIGLIQAGDTAGNIAGGVLVTLAARRLRPATLVGLGMLLLGPLIAALALASTVPALFAGYLLFGLLTVAIQAGVGALIQTTVDNTLMGRFIGLLSIVPSTASVLAMAFAATAGAMLGVRTVLVLSGTLLTASAAAGWQALRHTDNRPDPATTPTPAARR